jgi:hypothetical protein
MLHGRKMIFVFRIIIDRKYVLINGFCFVGIKKVGKFMKKILRHRWKEDNNSDEF